MTRTALVLFVALSVLAALQLRARAAEQGRSRMLAAGSMLPDSLSFNSQCWTGFILEADCGYCAHLLGEEHANQDVYWIIAGRKSAVDSLMALYPVHESKRRLAYWDTTGTHPLIELNVSGVPTSIVGSRRTILTASLRHSVVSPDTVSALCAAQTG